MQSSDEHQGGGSLQSDDAGQSMAALLDEEAVAYPHLRRGAILEGVVVGSDRDAILVDIGAKSEGVIPPQEMHCLRPEGPSRLKPGDKVLVFVVQPETPEGQIILSLDRARGEKGWRLLEEYFEQGTAFEGYVSGYNKGGLLVNVEGVNAFIPLSQIGAGRPERGSAEATEKALSEWVGRSLLLKVIELNRRRNRAILSERAALQEKRAQEKERLLQELREGDIRQGRVSSVRDFGVFVDLGGADGLIHLSELSWERSVKPQEMFSVGDEVEVYIMKVDAETKKIALSLRRARPEQWEDIVAKYEEGQIVAGQVTKLAAFGAFVRIEGPIEGLIHISELVDRRITHPKEVVREGDIVPVKIVRIERDRHRLGLSLRQAREAAEEMGYRFDDNGGVEEVPAEVRLRLGETIELSIAEPKVTEEPPGPAEEADSQAAVVQEAEESTAMAEALKEAMAQGPALEIAQAPPETEAEAGEPASAEPEAGAAEEETVTEVAVIALNREEDIDDSAAETEVPAGEDSQEEIG